MWFTKSKMWRELKFLMLKPEYGGAPYLDSNRIDEILFYLLWRPQYKHMWE